MFKTFFASKFQFTHDFITPFTQFSNQGSISIGNYMINYPAYKGILEKSNENKTKAQKQKDDNNANKNIFQRQREILEQSDWKLINNKEDNTSSIEKVFNFSEESYALEFISLVKDKCDELDHHPSWIYKANQIDKLYVITINLTSHFNNNQVSDKDYELGSYLQYEYEQLTILFNKSYIRKIVGFSLSALTIFYIVSKVCSRKKYSDSLEMTKFNIN